MRHVEEDKMNKDEVPLKLNTKGGVPMDVTENYILMSKEADEIQKVLHPGVRVYGTPFWFNNIVIRVFNGDAFYFAGFDDSKKQTIWLATQEQLQKLVDLFGKNLAFFYTPFSPQYRLEVFTATNHELLFIVDGNSFEQVWLKFVMKEKYKKEWRESKWKLKE